MVLEIVIVLLGIYAGYAQKRPFGYLFAITFLFFAMYDYLAQLGISFEFLASLNVIGILAGVGGMYLLVLEHKSL
jgi:hypothetical protein